MRTGFLPGHPKRQATSRQHWRPPSCLPAARLCTRFLPRLLWAAASFASLFLDQAAQPLRPQFYAHCPSFPLFSVTRHGPRRTRLRLPMPLYSPELFCASSAPCFGPRQNPHMLVCVLQALSKLPPRPCSVATARPPTTFAMLTASDGRLCQSARCGAACKLAVSNEMIRRGWRVWEGCGGGVGNSVRWKLTTGRAPDANGHCGHGVGCNGRVGVDTRAVWGAAYSRHLASLA